jgi:alanine racemase
VGTHRAQWIEIRSEALRNNVRLFRRLVTPSSQLAAVVKANGYGHGMSQVVEAIRDEVDWFAVHSPVEAARVRSLAARHPILIMGYVAPEDAAHLDANMHVFVSCPEVLDTLAAVGGERGFRVPVHIKVDTGTNRQGIEPEAVEAMVRRARGLGLEVAGIAAHFANIEDTLEHEFAQQQIQRFREVEADLERIGGKGVPWRHTACSAAALLFREADFTLVRFGISLYGHWPSRETRLSWSTDPNHGRLNLEPALTWKSVVGQIQTVKEGESVGYGRTWRALRPTRLAVIPIGYADGYPRALGNRARVLIGGAGVPVVGRVCMNILMADVTDLASVSVGDEVVLLGRQGGAEVSAEALAEAAGTINYEILARLPEHIPRVLVE